MVVPDLNSTAWREPIYWILHRINNTTSRQCNTIQYNRRHKKSTDKITVTEQISHFLLKSLISAASFFIVFCFFTVGSLIDSCLCWFLVLCRHRPHPHRHLHHLNEPPNPTTTLLAHVQRILICCITSLWYHQPNHRQLPNCAFRGILSALLLEYCQSICFSRVVSVCLLFFCWSAHWSISSCK